MYHFLTKLGRHSYVGLFGQSLAMIAPICYMGFHAFGHDITRELCSIRTEVGDTVKMSTELKNLVKETFSEIKDQMTGLHETILGVRQEVQWFISSGHEPIITGMTRGSFGAIIGLPARYNYSDTKQLPPYLFFVRYKSIFKKFSQGQDEQDEEKSQVCVWINQHSAAGAEYAKALILSDKAKKFSIAREIFLSESWRYYGRTITLSLSILLSFMLSRAMVQRYGLMRYHLKRRVPIYTLGGMMGVASYCMLVDTIDNLSTKTADVRAASINSDYKQGAIEYYESLVNINKIIRKEDEVMRRRIDEDGNVTEAPLRKTRFTFSQRLDYIKSLEVDEV